MLQLVRMRDYNMLRIQLTYYNYIYYISPLLIIVVQQRIHVQSHIYILSYSYSYNEP